MPNFRLDFDAKKTFILRGPIFHSEIDDNRNKH
jgi:hypothetical protein